MGQMIIITVVLTILVAVLSGCVTASVQNESAASEAAPALVQAAPSASESSANIAEKTTDGEGILKGRINNNSVEIVINPKDTLTFKVAGVLEQLQNINDGDLVRFSYKSDEEGQLNINKIEKVH